MYEPCVIEIPADWYKKEHERSGEIKAEIWSYCPVCGKVCAIQNTERWWKSVAEPHHLFGRVFYTEPTEECKRELNPETRTLPTFWNDDVFPKYVELHDMG